MHTKYLMKIRKNHRRFDKSLEVQPTTSSASTSTASQPYTVLRSLLSGFNGYHKEPIGQHSPLALSLALQQPQATQQSSGRNVWPGYDEIAIARTMRKYYIQNPDAPRIEMIRALYASLKPGVDFESFESRVDNMISTYCSIRSVTNEPNFSLDYKASQILGCRYFDDIHEALQHSKEYRFIF